MRIQLILALVFIVSIDLFLMSADYGLEAMALDSGEDSYTHLFTYEGSYISYYDQGNLTLSENPESDLPGSAVPVDDDSGGNYFTDLFVNFKNWLSQATGYNYFIRLITAFPNFLKVMGLPVPLSYALGVLWHGATFALFIMFLRGNI